MKIGIVSDTHGKADKLRRALEMLRARGAEAIVHCGDVGNAQCLEALADTGLPCHAVAGNTDCHLDELKAAAIQSGVQFDVDALVVDLGDGRKLAFSHGDNATLVESLLAGKPAYLCLGHTHQSRDQRLGATRIINPGAIARGHPPSVALLDTATDALEFLKP